jgi:regulatory protein
MAKNEWSMEQLTAKAETYCASAEHCISEMRCKLLQWNASDDQCEEIIAHLLDTDYINEQRYCHAFTHDKVAYQGWGRIKIRMHLNAKYLPHEAIDRALEDIEYAEYQKTIERVISSKKRTLKSTDTTAREKLIRFCMQRGFTYEEISEYL